MKKIFAIFLLTLLIVSSFPVLAGNGNGPLLTAQKIKERVIEKQQFTNQQVVQVRQRFEEAKENYGEYKAKFKEKEQKLVQIKGQWQACKDSDEEACDKIRGQFIEHGRNYVNGAADVLLKYLDQLYSKVELDESLSEEERSDMLEDIQEDINKVTSAKETIENSETQEELKEARDILKEMLDEIKPKIKYRLGLLYRNRIGEIIVRAEKLEIKLDKILDRAENAGYDVDNLDELIDEFNELIDSARDKYYEAREILAEKGNSQEAHDLLKEAHKDLNAAQKKLRDILHEIKGISDDFIGETTECWADRPDYKPGYDAGYFIWQSNCNENRWFIDWSGDTKQDGESEGYVMEGTIRAVDGDFVNVGVKAFDNFDELTWSGDEITFKAWVGPHFDGIHFQTTGNSVEFDIKVDGEYNNELVYIGKDLENPNGIPFTLDGESIVITEIEVVCEEGQLLVKGECVDEVGEQEIELTANSKYAVAMEL